MYDICFTSDFIESFRAIVSENGIAPESSSHIMDEQSDFSLQISFLQNVSVWHQLSRIFTWVVLWRDANNSKSASRVPEHKKKSEPFAYRLWIRISTVWCRWWDSEPRSAKPSIKLPKLISRKKLTCNLKCVLAHQPVSK